MTKRTLSIEFNGADGAALDFANTRSGILCQVQRALINVGTDRGTDPAYPTRGTLLPQQAFAGAISGRNRAKAQVNFAAIDTRFFLRETDAAGDEDRVADLRINIESLENRQLRLRAELVSIRGESVGVQASI